MSLKAGRVGVAPSEVDEAGHIIGGGTSDAYTKAETDALLANKANKSYITANNKIFQFAYDSSTQKYGYKAGAQGEFHPFDGAGGVIGMNLPDAVMTGITYDTNEFDYVSGGAQFNDTDIIGGYKMLWFDFILKRKSGSAGGYTQIKFPSGGSRDVYVGLYYYNTDLDRVKNGRSPGSYFYLNSSDSCSISPSANNYTRLVGSIAYSV